MYRRVNARARVTSRHPLFARHLDELLEHAKEAGREIQPQDAAVELLPACGVPERRRPAEAGRCLGGKAGLRAGDAVHVDRERTRVTARLGGSPGGIASGVAACVRAVALRHRTLGREPAREGEVSSRTRGRRGLLSRRSLGGNRDDRRAVDASRTNRTLRTLRASRTRGTTRPSRTLRTGSAPRPARAASRPGGAGRTPASTQSVNGEADLADLVLVTTLLPSDFPHHASLLGNTERTGQRSTPVMR
jgi:hypothetical protein